MSSEAILQTAFTQFAERGYEHVSLRQLAQACGVSDSLLSHHFGSKQQLWYEAADSVFAPLYQQMVTTLEGIQADNVAGLLRQNLKASLVLMASMPKAMAFMFRESEAVSERSEHLRQHYLLPYIRRIHELMDEARAQGLMRRLSHEASTGMVLGIMRLIAVPGLYAPEIAPHFQTPQRSDAFVDELVSIFYDGLLIKTDRQGQPHPVSGMPR